MLTVCTRALFDLLTLPSQKMQKRTFTLEITIDRCIFLNALREHFVILITIYKKLFPFGKNSHVFTKENRRNEKFKKKKKGACLGFGLTRSSSDSCNAVALENCYLESQCGQQKRLNMIKAAKPNKHICPREGLVTKAAKKAHLKRYEHELPQIINIKCSIDKWPIRYFSTTVLINACFVATNCIFSFHKKSTQTSQPK